MLKISLPHKIKEIKFTDKDLDDFKKIHKVLIKELEKHATKLSTEFEIAAFECNHPDRNMDIDCIGGDFMDNLRVKFKDICILSKPQKAYAKELGDRDSSLKRESNIWSVGLYITPKLIEHRQIVGEDRESSYIEYYHTLDHLEIKQFQFWDQESSYYDFNRYSSWAQHEDCVKQLVRGIYFKDYRVFKLSNFNSDLTTLTELFECLSEEVLVKNEINSLAKKELTDKIEKCCMILKQLNPEQRELLTEMQKLSNSRLIDDWEALKE